MNFFDNKNLGNHILQLCPKVVKHPVLHYQLSLWYMVKCVMTPSYIVASVALPSDGKYEKQQPWQPGCVTHKKC